MGVHTVRGGGVPYSVREKQRSFSSHSRRQGGEPPCESGKKTGTPPGPRYRCPSRPTPGLYTKRRRLDHNTGPSGPQHGTPVDAQRNETRAAAAGFPPPLKQTNQTRPRPLHPSPAHLPIKQTLVALPPAPSLPSAGAGTGTGALSAPAPPALPRSALLALLRRRFLGPAPPAHSGGPIGIDLNNIVVILVVIDVTIVVVRRVVVLFRGKVAVIIVVTAIYHASAAVWRLRRRCFLWRRPPLVPAAAAPGLLKPVQ